MNQSNPCLFCFGSGQVEDFTCPLCHGDGFIEVAEQASSKEVAKQAASQQILPKQEPHEQVTKPEHITKPEHPNLYNHTPQYAYRKHCKRTAKRQRNHVVLSILGLCDFKLSSDEQVGA